MPEPVKDILNVLVGSANMYIGTPTSTNPPDTLAFNDDWGTDWMHPGYSEDGLQLSVGRKDKEHMVDELSIPAVITIDSTSFEVAFGFAEATLENLRYSSGGGEITEVAAGTGTIGKKTLKLSETLEVMKLGFEGLNPNGFYRRVIIPRVVSAGTMKTDWSRTSNMQIYKAEFKAICAIGDIEIYDKTAEATA